MEKLLEAEIEEEEREEVKQKKTNVKSKSTKTKTSKQNPRQDEQILQPTQSQIAPLPVPKPTQPQTKPLSIPNNASPQASNKNECPSILEGTVIPAFSIVCENSIQAISNESFERNKKENKKPDDKKRVCGMIIPNLVLKPTKVLNQEMVPNFVAVQEEPQIPEVPILVSKPKLLRTLENIQPNCDKDIPKTNQKPTSTPMERRRPLKNTCKDVSIITAPMSSDTTILYTQE